MKNFLGSEPSWFENLINGSGIWIIIGVLAACFLVSVIFLFTTMYIERKRKSELTVIKEKAEGETVEDIEEEIETAAPPAKEESELEDSEEENVPAEEPEKETAKEPKKKSPAKKTATKKETVKTENASTKKEVAKVKNTAAKQETTKKETAKSEKAKTTSKKANYRVVHDQKAGDWIIKKDGGEKASRRAATKAEALEIAKKLSENQDANLTVHKKNGKFQKQ